MLYEYLGSEADEHHAGYDVGCALRHRYVALAELDAQHGDQEVDDTDDGHNPQHGL